MRVVSGLGVCTAAVSGLAYLAALVGASGCGAPDEIVASELPEAGRPPVEAGVTPCHTSSECGFAVDGGTGLFCSKASCDATMGVCEPANACDDPSPVPVCGCTSGLFFWNDCVRKQHGESASAASCNSPQTCTSTAEGQCPEGGYCAMRYDPTCQPLSDPRASLGTCWILPDECPTGNITVGGFDFAIQAFSCGAIKGCTGFCTALKERAPIATPSSATMCP